jgi:thiamine pyrophosphokinase
MQIDFESAPVEVVILADGEKPSQSIPLSYFLNANQVIVCDGAWRTAIALGRVPDAIVGDGDSLFDQDFKDIKQFGISLIKDHEQDTNDLSKAFRYVINKYKVERIVILGATGKREDHSIGNIFHLIDFAEQCPNVVMITNSGVFEPVLPPGRDWDDDSSVGQPFSIFATHHDTRIISEGLKWPLENVKFDSLWRGTLNRIASSRFSIHTDHPVIIFRPHSTM